MEAEGKLIAVHANNRETMRLTIVVPKDTAWWVNGPVTVIQTVPVETR